MSKVALLKRSFAGGELTPELYGQIALPKYQIGMAKCLNFITLPHGPAQNRPGFQYINAAGDSTRKVRLIPFSFNTEQTYTIEFGHQYIRWHTNGGTLLSGGTPYSIATPYTEDDLFDLHFVQSADVLTIVHPSYAPRELKRLGATSWTLTTISFGPSISAPTGVSATNTVGTGSTTYTYVVTAISADGRDESIASSSNSCTNNLTTTGNYNTITWTAVSGAIRYNVYRDENGLYGYIGQTAGTSFKDDNYDPDTLTTPPETKNPFTSTDNYPRAVSYFEQRRCFASTNNQPQTLWMTRSSTESNLNFSIPTQESDGIEATMAARDANVIRHLVPLSDMMMLTSGGEWKVSAGNAEAITPTTITIRPQAFVGCNSVQPVVTGSSILYAAYRGSHVYDMSYSWEANTYNSDDVSIMAPHLFDGYSIVDMAFMRAPTPVLWCVRSDGLLLGLTYLPKHQIAAWHRHNTDGVFESVCVVSEGNEDALYAVVKRNINGSDVRYIERLHTRMFTDQEDAFFVDSGLTYDGAATTSISGLDHLEGETVSVLADGAVHPQVTVSSGAITLNQPASVVHVGLPITADLETLPAAVDKAPVGLQGHVKNVNKVHLRVNQSSGIWVGPDESNLTEVKQRTDEPYGSPPALVSDEIELAIAPSWGQSGTVFIRQSDPLPLTLVSMTMEVEVGG